RATSYQSAFFSMRAICNLLGCTILHDKAFNKYYQFDLWTPTRNRRLKGITESDFRIAVHLRPNPRHIGYWSIFNRLICATKIDNKIWPYTLIDPIKKIMTDKFIKQRNNLHYKSSYWIFSDLLKCDNNESLEELSEIFTSGNSWTEENEIHFDVLLALQLLRMGTLLLNNIGESNPLIKLESSSILSWIEDIRELESFVAIGSTG
ncbi:MAG: hypothetical protein O7G85_14135, partial [Planctomycetota bacterium]|nr:hypothetical protein [Planctomycetota bacterium]